MISFAVHNFQIRSQNYLLTASLDVRKKNIDCHEFKNDLKSWIEQKNVAILCHGLLSNKECPTLLTLSECLLSNVDCLNCVVRFDFHGNGQSTGLEDWSYGGYYDEVQDLLCVIRRLREANANVSLILGHSRAATVVLLYGSQYADVPCIVSVAGRVEMSRSNSTLLSMEQLEFLERGETIYFYDCEGKKRKITPTCVEHRRKINILKSLESLRDSEIFSNASWKKLIIFHCLDDTIVPFEDSKLLYESALRILRNVDIHLLDAGGHGLRKAQTWDSLSKYFQYLHQKDLSTT